MFVFLCFSGFFCSETVTTQTRSLWVKEFMSPCVYVWRLYAFVEFTCIMSVYVLHTTTLHCVESRIYFELVCKVSSFLVWAVCSARHFLSINHRECFSSQLEAREHLSTSSSSLWSPWPTYNRQKTYLTQRYQQRVKEKINCKTSVFYFLILLGHFYIEKIHIM